nr:MAG TPA: hypothetical protein [Caudoviricetes sp.]
MRCLCAGHGVTLGSRMGVSHRIKLRLAVDEF